MRKRTVVVNGKMQKGYRYLLTAPVGRNFDPQFKPELTPQEMLRRCAGTSGRSSGTASRAT